MKSVGIGMLLVILSVLASSSANVVQAGGIDLVGFDLYSSGTDGTNVGGGYRYSSNSNDSGAYAQQLTPGIGGPQTAAISFPLHLGANTFTFAPDPNYHGSTGVNPGGDAGVNLFFNGTGTSFNPTTNGILSDLTAFVPTAGGAFAVPSAGTLVQDYGPNGGAVAYSGLSTFLVGTDSVTVTALSIGTTPSGSVTLYVTPEPSSLMLCGLGAVGLFMVVRRRRSA